MFSIEEFIIAVFCCVDDGLAEVTQGRPIRTKGFAPALSASGVLTLALVAECTKGSLLTKRFGSTFVVTG